MSFNIGKYRILEASRFTAYDPSTDEFLWDADDLQSFKIANTQDNQEDTGKNGEVIGVRKQNKKVTVTFTNGTLVTGAIASQLGVSPESLTTAKVRYTDSVTITRKEKVTLKKKAAPVDADAADSDVICSSSDKGPLPEPGPSR